MQPAELASPPSRRSAWLLFAALCGIGLAWALFTRHIWEDTYITYRAAENLATGHGLTFTPGERVHSFTSPLGVLLPAACSWVTGSGSPAAALWGFRLLSIAAYACGGVLLWRLWHRLAPDAPRWLGVTLIGTYAVEAKIVDFSINGMETGFLLLALLAFLHALLAPGRHAGWALGLAAAGLMWTRPDACVYLVALGLARLLFAEAPAAIPDAHPRSERRRWFRRLTRAAIIGGLLYLPWLVWAQVYYGSFVPHTVVAKSLGGAPLSAGALLFAVLRFPLTLVEHRDVVAAVFMPAYAHTGGWPGFAFFFSGLATLVAAGLWLWPGARAATRITSLGTAAGLCYLVQLVGMPVPWYLPVVSTLALLSLALGTRDLLARRPLPALHRGLRIAAASALGLIVLLSLGAAWQLRTQQRLIEDGLREPIGRWLREQATTPDDTVFLEPLGYIGYFSGLRMLDFPGLSAPAMVAARHRVGADFTVYYWPNLIRELRPDWLVLRPREAAVINELDPRLLSEHYAPRRTFSATRAIDAHRLLPGRAYLEGDSQFAVYQKTHDDVFDPPGTRLVTTADLGANRTATGIARLFGRYLGVSSPSRVELQVPAGATALAGSIGLKTFTATGPTREVVFTVSVIPAPASADATVAWEQVLPVADNGEVSFNLPLPARAIPTWLRLDTAPAQPDKIPISGGYWADLRFEFPVP